MRKKACHRCGSLEHLVAECPLAPWNRNKEQISNNKRRNSNAKESSLNSGSTGREIDLFRLMKVNKPQYLDKKKGKAKDNSAMDISEDESVTSVSSTGGKETMDSNKLTGGEQEDGSRPANSPKENVSSNEVEATGHEIQADVGEDNDKDDLVEQQSESEEFKGAEEEQQVDREEVRDNASESSGDESSHEEFNFGDRYNLRKADSKRKSTNSSTIGDHPKRSSHQMASTPPIEDNEGPVKKTLKQQEDNDEIIDMNKDQEAGSSTTKSL
jgi:hypothetical protein